MVKHAHGLDEARPSGFRVAGDGGARRDHLVDKLADQSGPAGVVLD